MNLRELLLEKIERTGKGDTAVIGWGRGMGHKGHMYLASSVITHAKELGGDPYFVVSRTVGKDDPITPEEKLAIYKKVFPKQGHIFQTATDEIPDLTRVLANLNQQGYRNAVVIVGADQVKAFQYLKQYNGKPDKAGNIAFTFDNLDVISRQETNDPSRGEEGPRATPMRQVLLDPTKSDAEQFAVWRDAMNPEISDDEVRDLMSKAKERMVAIAPAPKKAPAKKKEPAVAEGSEQIYKVLAVEKSNALSKKTMLKVKAGSIEDLFDRLAMSDWYPLEINGVEVIKGKRLKHGVAEGGADTSWSHGTEKITLQDILALTKHVNPINLPINDNLKSKLIHWDGNPEEIERINQVTVSNQFPILIIVDEQGQIEYILDGNHRLHKAIQAQAKTIPAKLIKPSDLSDKAKRILHIGGQGVAEGFSDAVKGIKRKVAGKQDPDKVLYQHGIRAKDAIDASRKFNHQSAYDKEDKMVDRYLKVRKVVKKDVAEDWQKVNKSDKTDGMSKKAVSAYRRENPGSKLKTAVTKKPSELKAGSKDAKRRKSFCARMSGVEGPMKDEKGRPTAKAKALNRWNCNEDVNEATPAAVRLGKAIQRTQGKTAASQARSVIPSSIPKKEEPKKANEAAYPGNVGIMELIKFFNKAKEKDPELVAKVKQLIADHEDKLVWDIIQKYTGVKLQGKEFDESISESIKKEAARLRKLNEAI